MRSWKRSRLGKIALWSRVTRSSLCPLGRFLAEIACRVIDAIRVNIRSDGAVSNKAVFVALAILPDGTRDVLGLWFQANEGAKFWAKVLNDLRNRGVQDILTAVVDGLKGFPQAIEAAFPELWVNLVSE